MGTLLINQVTGESICINKAEEEPKGTLRSLNIPQTMLFDIMVSGDNAPPIIAFELKQFIEKKCQWDCLIDVYLGIASGNLILEMNLNEDWDTDSSSQVFTWLHEFVEHVQVEEALVTEACNFRVRHVYMGTEEYTDLGE